MAFKPIRSPRGAIIQGSNGRVQLIWNNGCAPKMNAVLSKKQEIIDSEVLRRCAPLVPKRTGALERSGTLALSSAPARCSISRHTPGPSITTPARPGLMIQGAAACGLSA